MKTVLTKMASALALLPLLYAPANAQDAPASQKKIVIIKKSVDSDGNVVKEKIVKKGKAAEEFDLDNYLKSNASGESVDVSVDVTGEGQDTDLNLILEGDGGDNIRIFKKGERVPLTDLIQLENGASWSSCSSNRGYMGINEDEDQDDAPGVTLDVVRGSGAWQAGLRSNDVLQAINDSKTNQWSDVSNALKNTKPGDKVRVAYSRNGQPAFTDVTLTTQKESSCGCKACKKGFLGVQPEYNEDDVEKSEGMRVTIVNASGAQQAGLSNGDIITRLDQTSIKDWDDIEDFMDNTEPGQKVLVSYLHEGTAKSTTSTLTESKEFSSAYEPGGHCDETQPINFGANKFPACKPFNEFSFTETKTGEKEACLGVYSGTYAKDDLKGSNVTEFTEESAARDAGMQPGDIITKIDGSPIESQSTLWDKIATYKTGDLVEVAFLREGQPLSVKSTLKACKNRTETTIFHGPFKRQHDRKVIIIKKQKESEKPLVNEAPKAAPPASERSLKLEQFKVYPNPTQGQATIEFVAEPVPTTISLLDLSGKQLFREELNGFDGQYSQQFDLSEYALGTLILSIQQDDKIFTEQIIVNK